MVPYLSLNRTHRTSSVCPSNFSSQVSREMFHLRTDKSEDPVTIVFPWYCKQAMPRMCPLSCVTGCAVTVSQMRMVLSPDADTMYLWTIRYDDT